VPYSPNDKYYMVARQANIYRNLVSFTVSNLLEVLMEKYLRPNNLKVLVGKAF
jgi:hypothetical protein